MGEYYIYMAVVGVMSLIGMLVQSRLKSKIEKYSQIPLSSGLTGREIANKMLNYYNISDVKIIEADGFLSDHYNPVNKTVALSPFVYNSSSIAAAAIAAHECGHAVQHATAYALLQMRSKLVPAVQFASMAQQWVLMIAFMLVNTMPQIMLLAIIVFGITCLFSFITLPVEFDASRRALAWLDGSGFARGAEYDGAKDALKWAAMTYVVAALSALVMLVYLVLRFLSASRN
ncbi:MAG: zinc metallopeptidase [Saprospiraceae bacterium]|nr:zinc metallopeptidase [Saprospiraceae bacterium]